MPARPNFHLMAGLALFSVMLSSVAHADDWRERMKEGQTPDSAMTKPEVLVPMEESDLTSKYSIQLSLGAYLPWLARYTQKTSGEASVVGQAMPTIGGAYRFHWERFQGLSFAAQGWVTPMGSSLSDGAGSSRWLSGALIAGLRERNAEFRAGAGALMQLIRGAGGTLPLDNGGDTADFYRPDRSVAARVFYLDLGFAYQQGRWRYELDGLILGPVSSRRAVSMTLQAGVGLF